MLCVCENVIPSVILSYMYAHMIDKHVRKRQQLAESYVREWSQSEL